MTLSHGLAFPKYTQPDMQLLHCMRAPWMNEWMMFSFMARAYSEVIACLAEYILETQAMAAAFPMKSQHWLNSLHVNDLQSRCSAHYVSAATTPCHCQFSQAVVCDHPLQIQSHLLFCDPPSIGRALGVAVCPSICLSVPYRLLTWQRKVIKSSKLAKISSHG